MLHAAIYSGGNKIELALKYKTKISKELDKQNLIPIFVECGSGFKNKLSCSLRNEKMNMNK